MLTVPPVRVVIAPAWTARSASRSPQLAERVVHVETTRCRLEADHAIVLDLQFDAALLTAKAAMGPDQPVRLLPAIVRVVRMRTELLDDFK